jgi:hypothetical protein
MPRRLTFDERVRLIVISAGVVWAAVFGLVYLVRNSRQSPEQKKHYEEEQKLHEEGRELQEQYYKELQDRDNKELEFRRSVVPGKVTQLIAGPSLLVPRDREAYEEARILSQAHDELGITGMVDSGRIMLVPGGTQVRVIEVNGILDVTCRVRVLQGPLTGQDGWIPIKLLQRD